MKQKYSILESRKLVRKVKFRTNKIRARKIKFDHPYTYISSIEPLDFALGFGENTLKSGLLVFSLLHRQINQRLHPLLLFLLESKKILP